ncbi:hypothetical protein, partial [Enterobacter roggenkampii]|uniref:hypothetical protein n=1 Tax=Enterobacter roggenkampii TaxID=1812935 RepID=UPI002A83D10B
PTSKRPEAPQFPQRPSTAAKKAENHSLLISLQSKWHVFDINQMPARLFQRTINSYQSSSLSLGKN